MELVEQLTGVMGSKPDTMTDEEYDKLLLQIRNGALMVTKALDIICHHRGIAKKPVSANMDPLRCDTY